MTPLKITVMYEDGLVIVLMSKRVDWFKLSPLQALELATDLLRRAEDAERRDESDGPVV